MASATMTYKGVTVDFEYDYTPPCKGYRDSMGVPEEPDCDEEYEVTKIEIAGYDATDLFQSFCVLDDDFFYESLKYLREEGNL